MSEEPVARPSKPRCRRSALRHTGRVHYVYDFPHLMKLAQLNRNEEGAR